MYVGLPNPNIVIPVQKMKITNLDEKLNLLDKTITVLYNPESYTRTKKAHFFPIPVPGADAPNVQFLFGGAEMLNFDLFFDSVSAGAEVGGTVGDKLKFTANSLLPTIAGIIDVRDYTRKVTKLASLHGNLHRPPRLKVEWASLQFKGYLVECSQRFTRFDERGRPVRAILSCTFMEYRPRNQMFEANPLNSPDTTKYHTVQQGDSLWALAAEEYGDANEWRAIAEANGIANPRVLRNGEMLVVPALV